MNALGNASTAAGIAGAALGVGSVVIDTVNAPSGRRLDTAASGGERLGGSWAGAWAGAEAGAFGGPWGAFFGSVLGGVAGTEAVGIFQNRPPLDPQTRLGLEVLP